MATFPATVFCSIDGRDNSASRASRTLLSDRGKNFLSAVVKEVCDLYSIKKLKTTAYHLRTDGQVERLNSTLCLDSFYVRQPKSEGLGPLRPFVFTSFLHVPLKSDRWSPFYLLHGREPLLPMDVSLLPPPIRPA